jgi:pyridoxine 4-dehydrogenase
MRALRNYLSCLICACLSPLSWPRAGWRSLAFYAYLLNYYMISVDQLSRVGIGTSRAASLGSRMSSADFTTFLKLATEGGVNLIDTSDFYGSGDAERLIGQTLKKTGYPFFVITKAGLPRVHTPGWLSPLNQLAKKVKQRAGAKNNYSAAYLLTSVEQSNRRLGVQTVDALLLHEPTWADMADTDAWDGLATIRKRGLARYTGVSTDDYQVVEAGIRSGQVQLVQTPATWLTNSPITTLCRAHNIPVIANQVLQPYAALRATFAQHEAAIQGLPGLAGISLAQLLIGGVLAQGRADTVLFGTSNPAHLAHNIDSLRYLSSLQPALPALNQLFT